MTIDDEITNLWFAEIIDEDETPVEMTITRLAHELQVGTDRVRKVVFGEDETGTDPKCPYYMKKYHGDIVPVKMYAEIKGQLVLKAEAAIMATLQKMLVKFAKEPPETVSEAKELVGMYAQLDKISRLEDGKPTEIIKQTNYTPRRIIEIIQNDPMYGGKKRKYGKKEDEESKKDNSPRLGVSREADGGSDGEGGEGGESSE